MSIEDKAWRYRLNQYQHDTANRDYPTPKASKTPEPTKNAKPMKPPKPPKPTKTPKRK